MPAPVSSSYVVCHKKQSHIARHSCVLSSNRPNNNPSNKQKSEPNADHGRYSDKRASKQAAAAFKAIIAAEGHTERELKVQNSLAKLKSSQQVVRTDRKEAIAALALGPDSPPLSTSKAPTKRDLQARKIKEFSF